jgi:hypothetical protein
MHIKLVWGAVDLNTKLRTVLNGDSTVYGKHLFSPKTKNVILTICEHAPNLYYNDIGWHKHTGFKKKKCFQSHIFM